MRDVSLATRSLGRPPVSSTPVVNFFARAKERNDELRSRSSRSAEPAVPSKPHALGRPVPGPMGNVPARDNKDPENTASTQSEGLSLPSLSKWSLASDTPPQRTIGIMVTGVAGLDMEAFLEGILPVSSKQNITPVFITDTEDFSPFRERGLFFEHVPARDAIHRFGQGRDWQLYMDRRLGMLQVKWGLDGFVAFGNVDDVSIDSLAAEISDLGFWQRQIVRLFRIALGGRASRNKSTEDSDADSQVSRSAH